MKKIGTIIAAVIALIWLGLLLTDTRVLVGEVKVEPGQEFVVEDYGNLGESKQASLVCSYFNGRKVLVNVFWYAPNNIMGKDSCPFLYRP